MENNDSKNQTLNQRIQYLEEVNRLTSDALVTAASLGDFQKSIISLENQDDILKETRSRALRLIPFHISAFFLVDESTSEFYLHDIKPEEYNQYIQDEVDTLIDNGTFAWVIREKRPVIVSPKNLDRRLILHALTTTSRTRGMFIGVFKGDEKDIPHTSLSLLSIVLLNSANALESLELYSMIKEINVNLEKKVTERTRELIHRVDFENLIGTLSTTFINLSPDEIDNGINNALKTIAKFINAHHSFILILNGDNTFSDNIYEWCHESKLLSMNDINGIKYEEFPLIYECISQAKNISIPSVSSLSDDISRHRKLLPWDDIQSVIRVPLISGNSVVGILGFDSFTEENSWSEKTATQLKIVSDVFVNALERKWAEMERKELEIQLQHTHKMKGLGTLAAGVAHELNQPLMVIRTYVQMLLRGTDETSNNYEEMKMIEKNTGRMKRIIDHLKDFSRQTPSEVQPVDVNEMIDDAFLMMNEQLKREDIVVERHLSDQLPKVQGSVHQLEQVFVNLITNAMDAIRDKRGNNDTTVEIAPEQKSSQSNGKVEITTRLADDAGDFVEILVKDNGCGIPGDIAERVFDPFYTTKDVGKGTGLGLSISYGIIKDHKGTIEVTQTGPEGSTFLTRLPVA